MRRFRQATPPRVRKFYYATQGPGMLPYYTLSPLGYPLLKLRSRYRYQVIADGKPTYEAVSDLNQRHTWGLANLIVQVRSRRHTPGPYSHPVRAGESRAGALGRPRPGGRRQISRGREICYKATADEIRALSSNLQTEQHGFPMGFDASVDDTEARKAEGRITFGGAA